jgi:tetratricopeptide (TPR) repeat protein
MTRKRILLLILAVLVGGGAAYWFTSQPRSTLDPPTVRAEGIDPDVLKVVQKAREEVVANRNSAELWGHYGMVLFANSFWPERDVCLAESARLNPADPRWAYLLGVANRTQDEAAALAWFQKAVDANPADPKLAATARLRLAEAFLQVHKYDDAERLFRAERSADPKNPRAALGLGTTLLAKGQPDAAAEPLTAVLSARGAQRRARTLLAAAARQRGDEAAAAGYEQEAARLPEDPAWPDPFLAPLADLAAGMKEQLRYAGQLKDEGDIDGSLRILDRLARERPNVTTLSRFGATLVDGEFFLAAEKPLREALKLDPDHPVARFQLGYALTRIGLRQQDPQKAATFREAITLLNEAVAQKPDLGMAYVYRGEAEFVLGDLPAAVESMRKAVAVRPDLAAGHEGLIVVLEKANRLDEARAALAAAEKVVPPDDLREIRERLQKK